MTVRCPTCTNHRSTRTRACECCKVRALPSCKPERCMIIAGLNSRPGRDPHRHSSTRFVRRETGSWALCRFCMHGRLSALLLARARHTGLRGPSNRYHHIAEIISHYCGGPWTTGLSWFYWELHWNLTWLPQEGEYPQEYGEWPEHAVWNRERRTVESQGFANHPLGVITQDAVIVTLVPTPPHAGHRQTYTSEDHDDQLYVPIHRKASLASTFGEA